MLCPLGAEPFVPPRALFAHTNPILGDHNMTPFFKLFLLVSMTLLAAVNVADAFMVVGS